MQKLHHNNGWAPNVVTFNINALDNESSIQYVALDIYNKYLHNYLTEDKLADATYGFNS